MLSRLYDERVFTSSDDVVFSKSSSQALRRNGDHKTHRLVSDSKLKPQRQRQHSAKQRSEWEEEDESKSDGGSSGSDASAEEEDDEEVEEEEMRRLRGLKFPLQSPRHISASQSYLHRQRRRQLQHEGEKATRGGDSEPLSPTSRRRLTQKMLDEGAGGVAPLHTATRGREAVKGVATNDSFHDRPMELVFLPTGEIRPRDECPPGLKLPLTSMAPMRLLRDDEADEREDKRSAKLNGRTKRSGKSRAVHEEEESSASTGDEQQVNGNPGTRGVHDEERFGERANLHTKRSPALSSRQYRPDTINTRHAEENKQATTVIADEYEQKYHRVVERQRSRHLYRDERREKEEGGRSEEAVEDRRALQSELQMEKKRVLQKMTQLLEEQGKVQALQRKLEMYESKVASMESELKGSVDREDTIREQDTRIQSLTEELRAKDERISRLEEAQISAARTQEPKAPQREGRPTNTKDEDRISRLRQRESALATQLEDLMNRVTTFHAQVETWKVNSRDALESCDRRSDVLELMDRLWVDFPPFITDTRKSTGGNEGESSTITFLTKKLRQKEEELRITQLKYVELKELCARQCIREADLQNFINENRLRGKLVIPNNLASGTPRGQENRQVRANAQTYSHRLHVEEDESEDDGGDEEVNDADDEEVVVRRPRVFIDVKRTDQNRQQSDVEHVRLAPSPGLAQRYREQQQHQRAFGKPASDARTLQAKTSQPASRAATVASASRTLSTTRQASASTTTRTSVTQKRSTAASQRRTTGVSRPVSSTSRTTAATRASATSRRSSTQPPLSSRPWV